LLDAYDTFTDIEFNPKRSFNCQARSCALFVALARKGLLGEAETKAGFLDILQRYRHGEPRTGDRQANCSRKPSVTEPKPPQQAKTLFD